MCMWHRGLSRYSRRADRLSRGVGRGVTRTLTQQDPRNAEWQQDLAVSRAKMTMIDAENARDHWAKVVEILSDMQSRGVLLPGDVHKLEYARDQLGLD